ncbi:hypothetical protein GGR56DRAFT_656046 [Xylariaceae sp. FL0804]|nr:hypothetical protein GGR56DRAFT_656046 [Xylariaceae sp. FL0804]
MMRPFGLASSSSSQGARRAVLSWSAGGSSSSRTIPGTRRTFTSLPQLRPSIFVSSSSSGGASVFRSPAHSALSAAPSLAPSPTTTTSSSSSSLIPDVVPRSAALPGLAGAGGGGVAQARFGPRPTMARTSRLVRKRRVGFLARQRSRHGRKILERRRAKKRHHMTN